MKPIIVSGIQPTGNLHIGNYLGAVRNWVDLQNSGKYELYYFIADLHSLTGKLSATDLRAQVKITIAELLALGLDPDKVNFFVQSHVPEHAELAWIFNCVTPIGELERMTQFKDKSTQLSPEKSIKLIETLITNHLTKKWEGMDNYKEKKEIYGKFMEGYITDEAKKVYKELQKSFESEASAGLLTYPVLQAADILLYHGNLVPVGQDQKQHIELTRGVAQKFNHRYGEYFAIPEHKFTNIPKVMSLLEPEKKMSKSLGAGHVMELREEPAEIGNKLKRAVTATTGGAMAPGVANLLTLLQEFGDKKTYQQFVAAEKDKSIRYGDLKFELARAIAAHFADFRQKRATLLAHPDKLDKIMAKGAAKAQTVAAKTMTKVRQLIGIR